MSDSNQQIVLFLKEANENVQSLFKNDTYGDFIIVYKGKSYKLQKNYLKNESQYFESLISPEYNLCKIEISPKSNLNSNQFEQVLSLFYGFKIAIQKEEIPSYQQIAEFLKIKELIELLEQYKSLTRVDRIYNITNELQKSLERQKSTNENFTKSLFQAQIVPSNDKNNNISPEFEIINDSQIIKKTILSTYDENQQKLEMQKQIQKLEANQNTPLEQQIQQANHQDKQQKQIKKKKNKNLEEVKGQENLIAIPHNIKNILPLIPSLSNEVNQPNKQDNQQKNPQGLSKKQRKGKNIQNANNQNSNSPIIIAEKNNNEESFQPQILNKKNNLEYILPELNLSKNFQESTIVNQQDSMERMRYLEYKKQFQEITFGEIMKELDIQFNLLEEILKIEKIIQFQFGQDFEYQLLVHGEKLNFQLYAIENIIKSEIIQCQSPVQLLFLFKSLKYNKIFGGHVTFPENFDNQIMTDKNAFLFSLNPYHIFHMKQGATQVLFHFQKNYFVIKHFVVFFIKYYLLQNINTILLTQKRR